MSQFRSSSGLHAMMRWQTLRPRIRLSGRRGMACRGSGISTPDMSAPPSEDFLALPRFHAHPTGSVHSPVRGHRRRLPPDLTLSSEQSADRPKSTDQHALLLVS